MAADRPDVEEHWAMLAKGAGVTLCPFAGSSLAWRLGDYASEAKNGVGGDGEDEDEDEVSTSTDSRP